MDTHTCTAECWSHMIRYGQPEGCDAFAAREAAHASIADDELVSAYYGL